MSKEHTSPRPREDWGFFGPRSPTWRIWSSPTALLAFRRSIVVESFDPFLAIRDAPSIGWSRRRFAPRSVRRRGPR